MAQPDNNTGVPTHPDDPKFNSASHRTFDKTDLGIIRDFAKVGGPMFGLPMGVAGVASGSPLEIAASVAASVAPFVAPKIIDGVRVVAENVAQVVDNTRHRAADQQAPTDDTETEE